MTIILSQGVTVILNRVLLLFVPGHDMKISDARRPRIDRPAANLNFIKGLDAKISNAFHQRRRRRNNLLHFVTPMKSTCRQAVLSWHHDQ